MQPAAAAPAPAAPSFCRENGVFLAVVAILVCRLLGHQILGYNEQDSLVFAKHFLDPAYLSQDYYLSQPVAYRNLFNLLAGSLALVFPLPLVAVIGRLAQYCLFAYIMQLYARHFTVPVYLLIPALYFNLNYFSIVAGEWFLGGFETKVWAYLAILLALLAFIKRRYVVTWLWLGLSISFHVLVGLSGAFCLLGTLAANWRIYRLDWRRLLAPLGLAGLTGAFGIYAVLSHLLDRTPAASQAGSLVYVLLRNPHHTYPGFWPGHLWYFKLLLATGLLLAFWVYWKDRPYRLLASFALSSLPLFLAGLAIYYLGHIPLLKYYWFRFPDVMLPFFAWFTAAVIMARILDNLRSRRYKLWQWAKNSFLALTCLLLLSSAWQAGRTWMIHYRQGADFYLAELDPDLRQALNWVPAHTPADAVFLVDPFCQIFPAATGRAMFVSFKHAPQSEAYMLTWQHRLQLLNGSQPLGRSGFLNKQALQQQFFHLPEAAVQDLARQYRLDYLLTRKDQGYSFPVVYVNDTYIIYSLPAAPRPPSP